MTASLFSAPSMVCARCDGEMVVTKNAVGVERFRCPRCDGVARRVTHHPDDALVPQTLVRADKLLPLVRPGQLRCQVCAHGVEGNGRLCPACTAAAKKRAGETRVARGVYAPKPCTRCGQTFQPTGPRSAYCDPCTTPEQLRHRLSKRKHAKARRGE
jgi:hypothetical protein